MKSKQNIIFESYPDFTGSALQVYNALKQANYDDKFNLVWAVDKGKTVHSNYTTIPFFHQSQTFQHNILRNTAIIIDSNRYINKLSNCFRLHVRHGCSFKACLNYYSRIGNVDAIITTSDDMMRIDQQVWPDNIRDKFIITGLPSNDLLFSSTDIYQTGLIEKLTGTKKRFAKIIGWLPTYRQHRFAASYVAKGHIFPYGLPTINSISDYIELNEFLQKTNTLILVQMHHAQSSNFKRLPQVSNIKFVTEDVKNKCGITTHSLMSSFDALITDYSAAYHEYIILNRPICLTIDDLVEYNDAVGFCYDYTDWIKGEYALRKEHIYLFILHLLNNIDAARNDREASLHRIHQYIDGNSTNRVIAYLTNRGVI